MLKYYYHISQRNWPNNHILYPRDYGEHRCNDEPKISRICVAESVAGCVTALSGVILWNYVDKIFVYKTTEKVNACIPYDVFDADITTEMWLCEPTSFAKIGCLNLNNIIDFQLSDMNPNNLKVRIQQMEFMKKLIVLEEDNQLYTLL